MSLQENSKILVCSGFHRSATSATANYLANAGLPMGLHMMGGNITNPKGHYEDWEVVNIHNQFLSFSGSSWQFTDEVKLKADKEKLSDYIAKRDRVSTSWGFKDPRALLFLEQWQEVLGNRGRYLFIVRHWSSCIESLLHRHSRYLSHQLLTGPASQEHLNFWTQADLAARMWLSYNIRLLSFFKKNREQSLVFTQRSLFEGAPLLNSLNERLGFNVDNGAAIPFIREQLRDQASIRVTSALSGSLRAQLDNLWEEMLSNSNFRSDDEEPIISSENNDTSEISEHIQTILCNMDIDATTSASVSQDGKVTAPDLKELLSLANAQQVLSALNANTASMQPTADEDITSITALVKDAYKLDMDIYIALAKWLQRKSYYSEAINCFQWAITIGPVPPFVYLHIGQCYLSMGDDTLAEFFFDQAISRNAKNPVFYRQKAEFLRQQGQLDESIQLFRMAVELAPADPGFVLAYGDALEQSGNIDEAINVVNNALLKNQHTALFNMLTRFKLKKDTHSGKHYYLETTRQFLADKNLSGWLANALKVIGTVNAEEDFIIRSRDHWADIGIIQ